MDRRNATASWSGYSHQGKVGILIALKEILRLIDEGKDISNWWVEYETAEDIDIKCSGEVITRHQVKAYKDGKNLNDYKDVLNEQKVKFEHGELKIIQKGFQINDYDESSGRIVSTVPEDARFLHTICEVQGFGLTQEEYKNINLPYNPNFISNPNKIKLYTYPDNKKYCHFSDDKDSIMIFCKECINEILKIEDSDFLNDDLRQDNVYYEIIDGLDKRIRIGHVTGTYPMLSFNEILDTVRNVEHIERNNLRIIRGLFIKAWEEFISALFDSGEEVETEQFERVSEDVEEIFHLNDGEFLQLLRDLNPDKCNSSLASIEGITSLCKWDDFKSLFFYCLIRVKTEEFLLSERGYQYNGGYVLTLISQRKTFVKDVLNKMITNMQITRSVFEKKHLVNDRIEGVTLRNLIDELTSDENLRQLLQYNWKDASEESRFLSPDMSFITYDTAIEEINGE